MHWNKSKRNPSKTTQLNKNHGNGKFTQIANGDQNFFAIQGSKVQSLMLASPSSENLKIQLFTANTLPSDPRLVSTYAYFK